MQIFKAEMLPDLRSGHMPAWPAAVQLEAVYVRKYVYKGFAMLSTQNRY